MESMTLDGNSSKFIAKSIGVKLGDKTFFKIPISDLDLWDSLENKFSVPRGQYIIHLGTSSADLLFSKNFIVK